MRSFIHMIALCATLLLCSCDVHELPMQDVPEAAVTLHLNFDTELPFYQLVSHPTSRSESAENFDIRYIVRVYKIDASLNPDMTSYQEFVVTKDDISELNHSFKIEIMPGFYKFMVWTDYVDNGSVSDKYYDTSDFSEIKIMQKYIGNSNFRDAFIGEINQPISLGTTDVAINLERPLAKFNFISTDLKAFVTKMLALKAEKHNNEESQQNNDIKIDLNEYNVVFRYAGYLPNSFNMFINKPADSSTGVSFESKITQINENEAELGFDYVIVNGVESSVTVAIDIYDSDGELVASCNPVRVPVKRSKLTTVKSDFLTSTATGGVGINPGFDGDFNYEIRY